MKMYFLVCKLTFSVIINVYMNVYLLHKICEFGYCLNVHVCLFTCVLLSELFLLLLQLYYYHYTINSVIILPHFTEHKTFHKILPSHDGIPQ